MSSFESYELSEDTLVLTKSSCGCCGNMGRPKKIYIPKNTIQAIIDGKYVSKAVQFTVIVLATLAIFSQEKAVKDFFVSWTFVAMIYAAYKYFISNLTIKTLKEDYTSYCMAQDDRIYRWFMSRPLSEAPMYAAENSTVRVTTEM